MTEAEPILLEAVREPTRMTGLGADQWNRLLRQADDHGLAARLHVQLEELGLLEAIPERAELVLRDAVIFARFNQAGIRFEINRIQRALLEDPVPMILLKGGAYLVADLPPARGRIASDIDVMVPREAVETVRAAMLAAGWQTVVHSDYDERYYQTWMHEIAPLWHPEREIATDVHHTIAPPTSRVHPEVEALWAASVEVEDGLRVLCPADMVLHAATHLFNEEFRMGFRGLVDLHDLLCLFGKDAAFWSELESRAELHGCERVHYYLLHFTSDLLRTPVPPASLERARRNAPPAPLGAVMNLLVGEALRPRARGESGRLAGFALWCLYVRSHWLRMPPLLLLRHLSIKSWFRLRDSVPWLAKS